MKRFLSSLALLALVGFGCTPAEEPTSAVPSATHYVNAEFGFTLDHSEDQEVRDRTAENRPTKYLGMDVDFFASIRNLVRDQKPTNLAFVYAAPGLTVEAFQAALEASDPGGAVKVTSSVDVTEGDVTMKKITSTTQMGSDKVHYFWDNNGTAIVFSVFLGEGTEFDPILATIKTL